DTLTDAEQQFALWLAAHPRQTRAAQCAAYARFAGTPIDPVGLKALRTRREFFQFYKDARQTAAAQVARAQALALEMYPAGMRAHARALARADAAGDYKAVPARSEEHTSELQSRGHIVCRLLLDKKKAHDQRRRAV